VSDDDELRATARRLRRQRMSLMETSLVAFGVLFVMVLLDQALLFILVVGIWFALASYMVRQIWYTVAEYVEPDPDERPLWMRRRGER